jgi:hypothetical protein
LVLFIRKYNVNYVNCGVFESKICNHKRNGPKNPLTYKRHHFDFAKVQ